MKKREKMSSGVEIDELVNSGNDADGRLKVEDQMSVPLNETIIYKGKGGRRISPRGCVERRSKQSPGGTRAWACSMTAALLLLLLTVNGSEAKTVSGILKTPEVRINLRQP